jgi:segregation and condensation protein A
MLGEEVVGELSTETELVPATVFDLIGALRRVLTEATEEPVHAIEAESYSLEEQQGFLSTALATVERASFFELMKRRSKPFIITTFLAVLEMARTGLLEILIESRVDDFYLSLTKPAPNTPVEAEPAP